MMRPYQPGDQPDVLDVWYRASSIAHPYLSADFLAWERAELGDHWLEVADTTVYESAGRVVGFISLIGNEVGGIFVDPGHQGLGVGRALMEHAEGTRPFLELTVFAANTAARRFYDRYGFEPVAETTHEETGQPQLRLRLG
jgi:putative acetyltransferase